MDFAPAGALLIIELIIAFIVVVGAISLASYIIIRVCHKARRDALKKYPSLDDEAK